MWQPVRPLAKKISNKSKTIKVILILTINKLSLSHLILLKTLIKTGKCEEDEENILLLTSETQDTGDMAHNSSEVVDLSDQ